MVFTSASPADGFHLAQHLLIELRRQLVAGMDGDLSGQGQPVVDPVLRRIGADQPNFRTAKHGLAAVIDVLRLEVIAAADSEFVLTR